MAGREVRESSAGGSTKEASHRSSLSLHGILHGAETKWLRTVLSSSRNSERKAPTAEDDIRLICEHISMMKLTRTIFRSHAAYLLTCVPMSSPKQYGLSASEGVVLQARILPLTEYVAKRNKSTIAFRTQTDVFAEYVCEFALDALRRAAAVRYVRVPEHERDILNLIQQLFFPYFLTITNCSQKCWYRCGQAKPRGACRQHYHSGILDISLSSGPCLDFYTDLLLFLLLFVFFSLSTSFYDDDETAVFTCSVLTLPILAYQVCRHLIHMKTLRERELKTAGLRITRTPNIEVEAIPTALFFTDWPKPLSEERQGGILESYNNTPARNGFAGRRCNRRERW